MEEPAVSFKCNPNFPWMKCLKGHTFGFDAEHITGYIKFYNFNRFGNPVFKYEQIAINIFWRLSNYIQYSTKQEEWFWEDNICLMIGYPRGKPKDPLDVVNISRFKTPEGSMARGNFQTFQLIKKEVQFFHPRDISERLRKYISHLIIISGNYIHI